MENLEKVQKIVNKAMSEQGVSDYDDENTFFGGYDLEEWLAGYENSEYKFREVEHFGGEGLGDSMWKVFEIKNKQTDEVVNFRVSAWYDSWNGTEWTGEIEIVEPVEVTVIEWKRKK